MAWGGSEARHEDPDRLAAFVEGWPGREQHGDPYRGLGMRSVAAGDLHNLEQQREEHVSDSAKGPISLSHTGHSSASWISSKRALRGLAGLDGRGRLLKGMLGRLLILGRGRGKTGTTTSLVGHNTTK